ncbi:MAG: PAS domain S-box protein [Desulfobacterales bacterium]|nr:PAS domain S-box protein [Desulfobacterales bacterium]
MTGSQNYKTFSDLDLSDVDFLSILTELDDGVIIADTSGTIIFYNDQQAELDGLDPVNVIGRKVVDVYNLDEDTSKIMRCLKNRKPLVGHFFIYQTMKGKVVNTIHSVFPLFKNNSLTGAICFVKDYNLLDKTIASTSTLMTQDKPNLGNGTRFTFADIVSTDKKMLKCLKTARLAADSPSPVMLLGETGTGKEMFAQSVHNYSSRKKRDFMAVNCAAIPENLLEGILFGTTKGAFTSALDRPGLFEQANGGTLFLDEVDSMPVVLQSKLLRVLQEKKVRRVGSLNEIEIDLKIISTVNREPRQAIADNILRIDLFYRLGVVFIHIPLLRDRPSDIRVLTDHFVKKLNFILGKKVETISDEVVQLFLKYDWPGNVRELEHIIEGAMNMIGDEKTIHARHLPDYFRNIQKCQEVPAEKTEMSETDSLPPEKALGRIRQPAIAALVSQSEEMAEKEKEIICRTLEEHKGNVSRSARSIGISRQLLHYKIKKLGINRKSFL